MKKIIVATIFLFSAIISAQSSLSKQAYRNSRNPWILSVGFNALGNLGTKNPLKRVDEFSFRQPFAVAIEHRWTEFLSIEQDFSFNGYEATEFIDNGIAAEDILYFSTNTSFKWYYSSYLFDADWVDLYSSAGLGIFTIDEFNTSANVSFGALFWINPTRTIGVRIQGTGKFAFNADSKQFDNNHWQYFLQAVFRL
ncbi:MAG: hypothetical protein V7719_02275 [Psychroserpens sp.]|uniref:hypothetical protein n=1 Tax=Psychroserpens sp. TaxID=2020870 RepID=UPI00300352EB